jgi:hypothetical protein
MRTQLRNIWNGIKQRCRNPNCNAYPRYGARGIDVCDRWFLSFEAFATDMGPRPTPKHSIDRIDNDGHYEPGNCRWATHAEQRANQAYTQYVLHEGRAVKMSEYRVLVGISTLAIFAGFKDGSIPECCRRGHLFTADNTTIYDGKRWCATCRRASERRSWERRRPAEYDAMSPIQRETLEAAAKRVNGAVIVPDKVLHGVCRTNVISALKRKGWITPVEPFLITPAARALLTDDLVSQENT